MKRILLTLMSFFWLVVMLFFAIPFPMLIYYAVQDESNRTVAYYEDPVTALTILGLSIVLWAVLFTGYFHNWILNVFIAKRNIEQIKIEGVNRRAEILSAVKNLNTNSKTDSYDLKIAFRNLADTTIVQNTSVTDAKPYERRFEKGKSIDILIDKNMKRIPYFIFANSETRINRTVVGLRVLGWLTFLALVTGYYIYAYLSESQGTGWRFLSFGHPVIVCPIILFVYRFLARLIQKYIGRISEKMRIKFKGMRTTATLIKAAQTGTYINEQPMVRFDLEYRDQKGIQHKNSIKRIVGLLDLDMTKQLHLDIFYLPEAPSVIAFADDLDDLDKLI